MKTATAKTASFMKTASVPGSSYEILAKVHARWTRALRE